MLKVEIYTPEKTVFKGEATAVQMPGVSGRFEVLTGHAPLISALEQGAVRITTGSDDSKSYHIESGFAEVLENHVSILIEGIVE